MALPRVAEAVYSVGKREARVVVEVSDAEYATFTLERRVTEKWEPVLGTSQATVPPYGRALVRDWAFPSNVPQVEYRVSAIDLNGDLDVGTEIATCIGGEDYGADYLVSAIDPTNSVEIQVHRITDRDFRSDSETMYVPGREDPVVTTSGLFAPTATLELYSLTDADRQAMQKLLRTSPFMIFMPRHPLTYGFEDGVKFYAITKGSESRTSLKGLEPSRLWELTVQEIAPPAYLEAAFTLKIWMDYLPYTWSDVRNGAYTSPATVPSTWLDVLQSWGD